MALHKGLTARQRSAANDFTLLAAAIVLVLMLTEFLVLM
jgi:hypothetical protein